MKSLIIRVGDPAACECYEQFECSLVKLVLPTMGRRRPKAFTMITGSRRRTEEAQSNQPINADSHYLFSMR